MNKVIIFLAFILSITYSFAQNTDVVKFKGRVLDKKTLKPIPFANVGVIDSYYGAASDIDGNFTVKVPARLKNNTVRITAVGYSVFTSTPGDMFLNKETDYYLEPKSYSINEIAINAESLVLQKILRTTTDNISKNYIQYPFEYKAYYKCDVLIGDTLSNRREGVLKIFDNKGYYRTSISKTFSQINYKFTESRKSKDNTKLSDGFTVVDDLLTFDIIRSPRNILDKSFIKQYELKEEAKFVEKGDSIIIIRYKNRAPNLTTTGDAFAKEYSGRIFINLTNFAVIKNELTVKASDYSNLGRGYAVSAKPKDLESLEYKVITTYAKNKNYYYLSGISYITNIKNAVGENTQKEAQLIPVKINISNPEKIKGRDYYEDEEYRKEFWERFSIYFEGEV